MTQTKNNLSAFHWSAQPSQINWKDGKSVRQVLLDATRVNAQSYSTKGYVTNSEKAPR